MVGRRIDESPRKPKGSSSATLLHEHRLDGGVAKPAKKGNTMSKLLTEETKPIQLTIVESAGGKLIVRGEFGRIGVPTLNGRIYTEAVMQREFDRLAEDLAGRKVLGCINHPSDGKTSLRDVSHVITSLKIKDGIVIGEAEVLNTEAGKVIKTLAEARIPVPVSSRGMGSTKPSDDPKVEGDVVQADFILKTWDFVAEPAVVTAVPGAFNEDVDPSPADVAQMFLDEFPVIAASLQEDAIANAKLKVSKGVDEAVREAEERVRKEMIESFEKKYAESFLEAKAELSDELREEFSADPELGGARALLSAVYEMLTPYQANQDELAIADAAKAKDLEVAEAKEAAGKNEVRAVQAECNAYIEREIGTHPMVESIRTLVSKCQFENLDDAKKKLAAFLRDLPDRTDEGFVSEEEAKIREENAAMREKMSLLTERVELLNVKLKKAVDVGMEADAQRENAESRVVEAEEALQEAARESKQELKEAAERVEESEKKLDFEVYKHERVVGLANGRELLGLLEDTSSRAGVDRLVTEKGAGSISDGELAKARRTLQRGTGERQGKTELNESTDQSPVSPKKDDLGNDMGLMARLAGVVKGAE